MIGGCCGTTPAYVAKIRQAVAGREPVQRKQRIFVLPKIRSTSKVRTDNPVQQVFETREQIISVEMRANTFPQLRAMCYVRRKNLAAIGVDLFDVTDNSGAAVNIGAVGTAYRLQQTTQIPTLIHWTTRSRNLISMQSHLLEAEALGIRGIVALSGDHPKAGPYEAASLVPGCPWRGSIDETHRSFKSR